MRLKDFETLSRLIGGDARKQHSVLKGQFHAYIMRRMRWHARRYYYRNRDKVVVISLEDMNEDVPEKNGCAAENYSLPCSRSCRI